jgi:hypothetical protein
MLSQTNPPLLSQTAHTGPSGFGYKTFAATAAGKLLLAPPSALPPCRLSAELLAEESVARRGAKRTLAGGAGSRGSGGGGGVGPAGMGDAAGSQGGGSSEASLTGAERVLFQRLAALRATLAAETSKAKRITCAPWMVRQAWRRRLASEFTSRARRTHAARAHYSFFL